MSSHFFFIVKNQLPFLLFQRFNEENCLTIMYSKLIFSLRVLKKSIAFQFGMLSCISGVDLLQKKYRFVVVYDFLSLIFNIRLRIKVYLNEYDFIPSILNVYANSNWWEREVWDLFGIFFENHIDLRRILNDYTFEGYPLRKDYPLSGFGEVRYNQHMKGIITEMLQFTQEYRTYSQ